MNRIAKTLATLKVQNRKALIPYVTAGFPFADITPDLMHGMVAAGADVIELGVPFSDPMADGPTIQRANEQALALGVGLRDVLDYVKRFRAQDDVTPIVLMGYLNPIYVYPVPQFLDDAVAAGVDGLIVVDTPPEMDDELCLPAVAKGLNYIRLATPTTDDKRLPAVLANTSGFVYYVSITGITGAAAPDPAEVHKQVARIKKSTALPVCVGFGVRTPEQCRRRRQGR